MRQRWVSEGRRALLFLVDFLLLLIVIWGEILKDICPSRPGRKRKGCGSAFCFIGSQGVKRNWLGITMHRAGPSLGLRKEKEMTRDDPAGEPAKD